MKVPSTKQQLCSFLGMAGFYWTWIPQFGLITKLLNEALRGPEEEILEWSSQTTQTLGALKQALNNSPSLALPDLQKPFLYVHETRSTDLGVLIQMPGPYPCLVTYPPKNIDCVAQGWAPCLRALVSMVLLRGEASKLTLGWDITVYTPYRDNLILGHLTGSLIVELQNTKSFY